MNFCLSLLFLSVLSHTSWAQIVQVVESNISSTSLPFARNGHSFDYDNNGGFLIFGGYGTDTNLFYSGYLGSLWRYDTSLQSFSLLGGIDSVWLETIDPDKPPPRSSHLSWIDNAGNLWISGGSGYDYDNYKGTFSDTWVYNVSKSQWRFVTGSNYTNDWLDGYLAPHGTTGSWRDVDTNYLYIFGGSYTTPSYFTYVCTYFIVITEHTH